MSRWFALTVLGWFSLAGFAPVEAQSPYINPDLGVMPPGAPVDGHYKVKSKNKAAAYGPVGPIPSGPGQTIYRELPDDTGWLYDDTPLERMLKNSFRHSYFRADYLLWDIEDPGKNVLSAPTNLSAVNNPVNPNFFTLTDRDTGTQINSVQPSLADIFVNENNGIRGTFGVPIYEAGALETSVFVLQTSTASVTTPHVRGINANTSDPNADTNGDGIVDTLDFPVSDDLIDAVVQAVLIDGQVPAGDNFLLINAIRTELPDGTFLYTPAYSASLKTSVWGAETNFITDTFNPNSSLAVNPLVGFRYFNFREDLRQTGKYTFAPFDPLTGLPLDPVIGTRTIDATTNNNIFGPQIGLRSELKNKWFAIGVQPKVMLGLNSYKAELLTQGILTPDEAERVITNTNNTFGVLADLEVYSKLRLGSHLSLRVGYNFLWSGLITRPADNIVYNIQSATGGLPATSAFVQDVKFSGAILQGLSIGAQFEY